MQTDEEHDGLKGDAAPHRLRDWLWRPWYAKLWWAAAPVYWGGMLASIKFDALGQAYHSALAGFANVLFFPPVMGLILCFGFIRNKLKRLDQAGEIMPLDEDFHRRRRYGPSGMPSQFDPLDPRAGVFWIGNTLNPLNPGNINRVS